jgi:small subunit ribosomal protein S3
MGQKAIPTGLRLGIIRTWNSKWYAEGKQYQDLIYEDMLLRRYIKKRLQHAAISSVGIERTVKKVTVNIFTARPGIVIGKKGEEVERLKGEIQHLTGKEIYINIREIKRPETDAARVAFRRTMKKAISTSMRLGAEGIKVVCSGRLGGAEIARTEKYRDGRIPLHTLRADIDYATATAHTTSGTIGVKVWICKGEIIRRNRNADEVGQEA